MARKLKCPECGKYNDKDEAIYHQNRYYCKVCYDNVKRSKDDYKELIEYICDLFNLDAPTGWILKQIKDFKEQYGYTYRGIKSTLHYFFEIEDNSIDNCEGIGIVPFVYDKAKQFYIDKKDIKDNFEASTVMKDQDIATTINIKREPLEKTVYKELGIIDITKL